MKQPVCILAMLILGGFIQPGLSQQPELLFQYKNGIIAARPSPTRPVIAFTTPGYSGLYIWRMGTKKVEEITSAKAAGFGYAWSPTGDDIVYKPAIFFQNRRYNSLVVYHIKTNQNHYLISDRENLPGKPQWIAPNAILLQGYDGEPITVRENPAIISQPYYRAMGTRIEKIDPSLGSRTTVTDRPYPILTIAVGPDRVHLAFEEYGGNLFILNIRTQKIIDIGAGNNPVWSPDGKQLAFMKTTDDGYQILSSDIYIVRVDGTGLQNITDGFQELAMRPTWQPDGTSIIFDNDDTKLYEIRVNR
ncbi:MAG: TolB family protein [Fidelibacterota bacterium]